MYYIFQSTSEGDFHTERARSYGEAKKKMKRMLSEEKCKVSIVREEDL